MKFKVFFIQCVAFVYIFLILIFFPKNKKKLLQLTFEKKTCAKREKKKLPRPPAYQMIRP